MKNVHFQNLLVFSHPCQQLATPIRQCSPWQLWTSTAVSANPQELTQLLLLVRGFYRRHQCPRILRKQSLDLLFIHSKGEKQTQLTNRGEKGRPDWSGKLFPLFYLRCYCCVCTPVARSVWPGGCTVWEDVGECCEKAWHVLHCVSFMTQRSYGIRNPLIWMSLGLCAHYIHALTPVPILF